MPWKLIAFILIIGLVVVFIGFNIENKSDISFGFAVIEDVPIFISLFTAFLLGAIVALPFTISKNRKSKSKLKKMKKEKKTKKNTPEKNKTDLPAESGNEISEQ
jgi:uncharacterized integral membrane protein